MDISHLTKIRSVFKLFEPYTEDQIIRDYQLPDGRIIQADGFKLDGVPLRLPIVGLAKEFLLKTVRPTSTINRRLNSIDLRHLFSEHFRPLLDHQSYIMHGEIIMAAIEAGFNYSYRPDKRRFYINGTLKKTGKIKHLVNREKH